MAYYFYQIAYRDSKVLKDFGGLIQKQCSPSFDCNWGKQNTPLHVGTSYTHDVGFYSNRNVSATQHIVWAGSLNPQIVWMARGLHTLQTTINGGHSPLKFPPYSLFRAKGGQKTTTFFTHFHVRNTL